jgi:hypothetical protein
VTSRWRSSPELASSERAKGRLISIRGGPPFSGSTSLFEVFGCFGCFCSTVLVMRVLVAVLRNGEN